MYGHAGFLSSTEPTQTNREQPGPFGGKDVRYEPACCIVLLMVLSGSSMLEDHKIALFKSVVPQSCLLLLFVMALGFGFRHEHEGKDRCSASYSGVVSFPTLGFVG